MNKIFFFPLLIQLLSSVYTNANSSPCLETSLLNGKFPKCNSNLKLTEDDCRNKATTDKKNFICLLSEDHKYCEEFPKSACITRFLEASVEQLSNDDCMGLETSSRKYICILNSSGNRCIEKIKKLRAIEDDEDGGGEDDGYYESSCELTKYNAYLEYNLTQEYCSKLKTYSRCSCYLSANKHYCIEVHCISHINRLKLFIITISLLFLL